MFKYNVFLRDTRGQYFKMRVQFAIFMIIIQQAGFMNNIYADATEHFKTIIDFLRFGISQANKAQLFFGHGTDNASDDIRSLVLGTLHLPFHTNDALLAARLTTEEKQQVMENLMQRIIDKVPVPYITNEAFFCDLPFYVDERVLIPRSPIAELIKQQFTPWVNPDEVMSVLDLCTGSGCIAIACAYAFPDAHIDAIDLSMDALQVAAINCERHDLQGEVELVQSDCWENVPFQGYDIIVSNPPYVGDDEMDELPEEYLHEPDMALRTADNGLSVVVKILESAHHYLSDNGILVVEVGNSEMLLIEMYPDLPFTWLEFEHGGSGVFLLTCHQLKEYFER